MKEKKVTIATDLVLKPALPSYTIYSPIPSLPPSLTFYEPSTEFRKFLRYSYFQLICYCCTYLSYFTFILFLLFGRRPNKVIEIACFDSKLQQARNTCERKQAKRCDQNVCRVMCHDTAIILVTFVPQTRHGKQIGNRNQTY